MTPERPIPETQWLQLSEFIAVNMGLNFPPERRDDLQRGLKNAALQFGYEDSAACITGLLAAPPTTARLQVLASQLTTGETYFFRDKPAWTALTENILPELIRSRRDEQRLRFWSAGCCTGEEPYSLAILLQQLLPDLRDWRVTITATDINPLFLKKAEAGSYGEWSFRDAPPLLKQEYFNRNAEGRHVILPEIRQMVNFSYLNLVDDVYPSLETDTNAMDLILCRNVLMYFTPPQIDKVIANLRHALVDGGWLAVSPSESVRALFPNFINVDFPGAILFKKNDAPPQAEPLPEDAAALLQSALSDIEASPSDVSQAPLCNQAEDAGKTPAQPYAITAAQELYRQGRYAETANALLAALADHPPEPRLLSMLARSLANQGDLEDAQAWCERWIASDKMDPAGHYLRALVLCERGDLAPARDSLQHAIYIDPEFVLAHFALGNLERACGKLQKADRHFFTALDLLGAYQTNAVLPESDGLTAGRLSACITSMTAMASPP